MNFGLNTENITTINQWLNAMIAVAVFTFAIDLIIVLLNIKYPIKPFTIEMAKFGFFCFTTWATYQCIIILGIEGVNITEVVKSPTNLIVIFGFGISLLEISIKVISIIQSVITYVKEISKS